jgi:tryptophan synthase alpha chain
METSSRIAKLFSDRRANGCSSFIAYVCACDPDFDTSLTICRTLIEEGVDLLELGVPFSDPLADGLTNQLAAQRALEAGCKQEDVFKLVREIRKFSDVPIVFYTYFNLIFSQGIEEYVQRSKEAGVDGLLTLDLPPEEAEELIRECRNQELDNIFIIAPTTPKERIAKICSVGSGFFYYVSREGVTGEREDLATDLEQRVATIRSYTDLPVVVGFGISTAQQVEEVSKIADGVVVGSALVNCISQNIGDREKIISTLAQKTKALTAALVSK